MNLDRIRLYEFMYTDVRHNITREAKYPRRMFRRKHADITRRDPHYIPYAEWKYEYYTMELHGHWMQQARERLGLSRANFHANEVIHLAAWLDRESLDREHLKVGLSCYYCHGDGTTTGNSYLGFESGVGPVERYTEDRCNMCKGTGRDREKAVAGPVDKSYITKFATGMSISSNGFQRIQLIASYIQEFGMHPEDFNGDNVWTDPDEYIADLMSAGTTATFDGIEFMYFVLTPENIDRAIRTMTE